MKTVINRKWEEEDNDVEETQTCFLDSSEFFSCSSRASPIRCTTALALSISAQAKDFSWLTNLLASSEA